MTLLLALIITIVIIGFLILLVWIGQLLGGNDLAVLLMVMFILTLAIVYATLLVYGG